jgi:hypothetical protein
VAIAYVGGQVAGRANPSSAVSVNYALTGGLASVPAAGDLVIVTCVTGSSGINPAMAVTTPATWTALGQINPTGTSLDVSYKFMGGTPDTAVTIPGTTDNAAGEAYAIQVWRGVDPTTPLDGVAPASASGTGTGRPDPAAITPATAGAVVVICGGGKAGTGANYTAPANYTTNFLTAFGADTTDAMVGMGYWTGWTSGAENPATYTGGTTGGGDSWAAYTLVLRPEPATQALTPSLFTSSTGAFYAATVAAGAVALTAALFTNSNSFYAATASPGAVAVTAPLVTNSQSFYAPTVSASYALTAARVDGSQTFYAPTVGVGPVDLTPALYSSSSSFYAATVAPGVVSVSPALATNAQAFYAATVTPGAAGLTAARYDNAEAFYAPSVVADGSTQALTAELAMNTAVFYGPEVSVASAAQTFGGWFAYSARTRKTDEEIRQERIRLGIIPAPVEKVVAKVAEQVTRRAERKQADPLEMLKAEHARIQAQLERQLDEQNLAYQQAYMALMAVEIQRVMQERDEEEQIVHLLMEM